MSNKKISELVLAIKGKDTYEGLVLSLRSFGVHVSVGSLKKYVSHGDKRYPSYETLAGLAGYAKQKNIDVPSMNEITAEYHIGKVGSLRKFVPTGIDSDFSVVNNIPIISLVPADGPILAKENIEGVMPILRSFVPDPENTFCLKVRGDSMIDIGIEDGDSVLIHSQSTAENGQTVIARIDGEVTCKRFYIAAGKVRLEPANSKYKVIENQNIEIVGVVIRIIKNLD
ncbi:MAG TPA: transcriptional repressor LexA [Desulfosporosinus sp.]|nr:transcriptional repressor LexA [Desulfosporosinus sp.]